MHTEKTNFDFYRAFEAFRRRFSGAVLGHPRCIALLVFAVCLLVHLPFVLFDCFGEQDAARLALRAVYGNLSDQLKMGGQWPFSYPLYIHMLYGLLRAELISAGGLPRLMSALSLISSAAFSALYFLFVYRSLTSTVPAMVATAVLQFLPVFFFNSIYGFPTMVALAFFMAAATLFQHVVCFSRKGVVSTAMTMLSALLFIIGVLFKVDMLLGGGLVLLPLYQSKRPRVQKAIFGIGAAAVAIGAFLVLNQYAATLSEADTVGTGWQAWHAAFFAGTEALFSAKSIFVLVRSAGYTTPALCLVSIGICLLRRQARIHMLGILAAGLPIAIFWGMMAGNSARHDLIPAAFAPFLLVLPISFLTKRPLKIWLGVLASAVVINYVAIAPSSNTVHPSGRLLESAVMLRSKCERYRNFGRGIAAESNSRIFVVTPAHLIPIFTFEVITSEHLAVVQADGPQLRLKKDGGELTVIFADKDTLRLAEDYEQEGFVIRYAPD